MALFGKKTNTKHDADTATARTGNASNAHILRHARITEKATIHSMSGVYVFDVASKATKRDIVKAMRDVYNVTPQKVRVASIPTKTTRSQKTGITGVKRGGKKAYVYLKKGETITIS